MKAKYLWTALIALVFAACDDSTDNLGLSVLPGMDDIEVHKMIFSVQTESTISDAVYAKTNRGYVGRFTDTEHDFGYYEGSFLTELNCVDDLVFPKPYDPITNKSAFNMAGDLDKALVSTQINLGYYSFFGDSLAPMKISVYRLDKKLENNHYTNIDPSDYAGELLGSKTFTAVDRSDSTKTADDPYYVSIPLNDTIGKAIVEKNWDSPGSFANSDAFINDVFKGVYIKNETGDGTILYIDYVDLEIKYNRFVVDSVGNKIIKTDESADSTVVNRRFFASTMEVIQANQIIVSEAEINKKLEITNSTFLKSPAGIWTKGILPIDEIADNLNFGQDTINSVKLVFTGYHHETVNEFSMSAPNSVLLIKEKEVKEFFEKNQLPNNTSTYVTSIYNNKYTFSNITRLITSCVKELEEAKKEKGDKWDDNDKKAWLEDNAIVIIPVSVSVDTSSSTASITHVQHDLSPSFIKLEGGKEGELLDLEVVYSKFKN